MKWPYLEVTFRHGRPLAAYLYLSRSPGDRSRRTSRAGVGMLIDYTEEGRPIGIEITAPDKVTVADINGVLAGLNVPTLTAEDIAPLRAA
ncbi:DUF2283 domain-containing protein [uncultured Thiodictyon sp.]|uniref:DUF2283 domain-containing protein n=1 Tax=uncultured Thiodictyon sp. TaxID=1846217 RepID=UPI0025E91F60|nr:DUF2283 domain-containing protein [uncultured Thiodictyon sp.]